MNQDLIKEVLYYQEISPGVLILVLAIAFVLGAIHALGPGHGKSLMASYLVGSRGRIRDVFTLGITITISHIFSVVIIGFLALWVTNYFWTGNATIWLSLASGIIIVLIGLWLFIKRFRLWKAISKPANTNPASESNDSVVNSQKSSVNKIVSTEEHHHHHSHEHNHDESGDHSHHHYHPELSLWSNIALGISGGIVPCPKALVILLLAISLQRITLGLVIISVFSLGLAAVLIAVGIITIKASELLKSKFENRRLQFLPLIGSVVIIGLGMFLTYRTVLIM
jgi:nickel/cobalt transporter (NicO) family protein